MEQKLKKLLLLSLLILNGLTGTSWATNFCEDANMVYCYVFDSDFGSGTIEDVTANSNDMTPQADAKPDWANADPVSFGVTGDGGGYADFNGTDAYASDSTTTKYFASSDMTWGAWINKDTDDDFESFFYHDDDYRVTCTAAEEAQISFIKSGGTEAHVEDGGNADKFTDDTWVHVVVDTDFDSASASDTIFYFNTTVDAGAAGGSFSVTGQTDDITTMGARVGTGFFDGQMDEIFLYTGSLTSTQIEEIYNYGLRGVQVATGAGTILNGLTSNGVVIN